MGRVPIRLAAGLLLAWACLGIPPVLPAEAAPPLTLAQVYPDGMDPSGYWVSEKLDGVRAYWDGSKLWFRSGQPVGAPAWFTRGFPPQPLDGELWLGRGEFELLSGIVRKVEAVDAEWKQVKFMLFELPLAPGTFTERKDQLQRLAEQAAVPWLVAVEQFRVSDRKALESALLKVVAGGGEGLMLHRADAPYTAGRSDDLLKLKPYLDSEAVVVGHLPGKGRHTGRLGALLVEGADGRRFRLGTGFSDAQREAPPPVGTLVTYRYQGLTEKGLPRFPSFLRVRETF